MSRICIVSVSTIFCVLNSYYDINGSSNVNIGAGVNVEFKCSKHEGACLLLKDWGSQYGITDVCTAFKKYAGKHGANWTNYFERENCDVKKSGITLVTGVVKTSGWGHASIKGESVEGRLTFSAPVGGFASADAKGSYKIVNRGSVVSRAGPPQRDIDPAYVKEHHHSGFPRDQTAFIRYLKIKHRLWGVWTRIEARGEDGSTGFDPSTDERGSPQLETEEGSPEQVRLLQLKITRNTTKFIVGLRSFRRGSGLYSDGGCWGLSLSVDYLSSDRLAYRGRCGNRKYWRCFGTE